MQSQRKDLGVWGGGVRIIREGMEIGELIVHAVVVGNQYRTGGASSLHVATLWQ